MARNFVDWVCTTFCGKKCHVLTLGKLHPFPVTQTGRELWVTGYEMLLLARSILSQCETSWGQPWVPWSSCHKCSWLSHDFYFCISRNAATTNWGL